MIAITRALVAKAEKENWTYLEAARAHIAAGAPEPDSAHEFWKGLDLADLPMLTPAQLREADAALDTLDAEELGGTGVQR